MESIRKYKEGTIEKILEGFLNGESISLDQDVPPALFAFYMSFLKQVMVKAKLNAMVKRSKEITKEHIDEALTEYLDAYR